MRVVPTVVCAVLLTCLAAFAPARAAGGPLTGKMALFNYLIGGTWSCSTKMSAMDGHAGGNGRSTVTFDVVPGNVFHDHVASAHYADDDYFGFDAKSGTFWNTSADSTGAHEYATSKDGVTYSGRGWEGSTSSHVVSTYKKLGPTHVAVHEVITANGQVSTFDADCTK